MPTVSIILPTFNRTGYVRVAIESVFAQTFGDWELIVADDGSQEHTRAFLRSLEDPRVRKIWLAHSGVPSVVRNAAIRQASGRYLAFIDSDDKWAPNKLERQLEVLRARPGRRWSHTCCDRIDEHGDAIVDEAHRRRVPPEGWTLEPLLQDLRNQVAMPSVMAERDLVNEIGGFDETQLWCEDYDLCLRMAMRSPVAGVAEALCSVRTHGDHYSADRIAEYESRIRLYGKLTELIDDPRLRALCGRRRAEHSLVLAGLRGNKRDYRGVWATLGSACSYSWSYPDWWFGAVKAAARPLLAPRLLDAYRRLRR